MYKFGLFRGFSYFVSAETIKYRSKVRYLMTSVGFSSILTAQSYFGVMFFKHYLRLIEEKLLERLNTDWAMQMFCEVHLQANQMI